MASAGLLQMDRSCAHYALTDNDGNGVLSAGDSLKIEYRKCLVYYLSESFTGTINIKLTSVDNAATGVVAGTVDFGDGLVPEQMSSSTWLGSLKFQRMNDLSKEQIEISASPADDLRSTSVEAGVLRQESYRHPQLIRTLRRDTARTSLAGSMSWASDRFGGRIDITLDPQLSGHLNTFFDTGSLRFTGAGNARIVMPASNAGAKSALTELDSDGDGRGDSTLSLSWDPNLIGYLMEDQSTGTVQPRDDSHLALVYQPAANNVDIAAPLRFQFNRPLRADTVLHAQLVDLGSPSLDIGQGWSEYALTSPSDARRKVNATVAVHGALLLIQPSEALQYGHTYQVLVSNIGDYASSQSVVLRAADGAATVDINVQWTSFATDDSLWIGIQGAGYRSVIMPGRPATISASAPKALNLPLRYQWSQLSGPSMAFSSADAASTDVRWVEGGASGVASALLQLTVTDARGRRSTVPVEVQAANLSSINTALYFSGAHNSTISQGQTHVFTEVSGTFATFTLDGLHVRYDSLSNSNAPWFFDASDANGQVPPPGTYLDTVAFTDLTKNVPHMNFGGGGTSCNGVGSFKVLERELAIDGSVSRLAIDFEERCLNSASTGPVRGSLRINSSLPIQP